MPLPLAADIASVGGASNAFPPEQLLLLAATTFIAAAVNAVAGGGTILTFPVVAAILPDGPAGLVAANATSTLGLWPGAIAAAWAGRAEWDCQPRLTSLTSLTSLTRWLLPASVGGAIVGAALLLALPSAWFGRLVPWLILSAAVLFTLQPHLAARLAAGDQGSTPNGEPTRGVFFLAWGLQFLVAVYGGYFGAGIGILMLAVLGCLGVGDIHRLNAVKNLLATAVNGTTAVVFASASILPTSVGGRGGIVSWPLALMMALASISGAVVGVRLMRRMPAPVVRRIVALIGFGLAGYYFLRG
ncbi:MAG: sulfite exporter TauE/SafE family protein [Planctomycetia bacterium]